MKKHLSMFCRFFHIFLASALLAAGCAGFSSIDRASERYQQNHSYDCLVKIYPYLSDGMQRKDVERLLGQPDYSPIVGQYYYDSNKTAYSENQDRDVTVGLVVDYRDKNGNVTEILHDYWIGPIGE